MPTSDADIAVRGWGPVTVRVAWTLRSEGVKVHPDTLRDAREHVWLHLDPDCTVDVAEDRAEPLVRAFVARALQRTPRDRFPEDRDMPLPRAWRDQLYRGLSRNARFVLLQHLADGHPLDAVAQRLGEDALALEAAREGLREVLRQAAARDGVDLETWADDRLDHLLHRLAQVAAPHGPPLLEIVDGLHPEHCATCVRSARALRLVRAGDLRRADLVAPDGDVRPTSRVQVLALHFHPDARRHRLPLLKELGVRSFPIGEDLVLVDAAEADRVREVVTLAAEVGSPSRDHLRGASVQAPGRWSKHGLVGPGVEAAVRAVRALPWGQVDGVGELPAPLPEPPSARRAWLAVALLGAATLAMVDLALRPDPPRVDHPLTVDAVRARQGVWVDFDVNEEAYVFILNQRQGRVEVVLDSQHIADKIRHATGDGGYRLHTLGDAVLVASASHPLPHLAELVERAAAQPEPLAWLAASIREGDPKIDVRLHR